MSMDQLLTKPRLGTCHKFYIQPFSLANSKTFRTLNFSHQRELFYVVGFFFSELDLLKHFTLQISILTFIHPGSRDYSVERHLLIRRFESPKLFFFFSR